MVFEDLPLNLMALKEHIEGAYKNSRPNPSPSVSSRDCIRPSVKETSLDFELFKEVIEKNFGQAKTFPTREDLRSAGLGNLEKSLSSHGGAKQVTIHAKSNCNTIQ